MLLLLDVEEVSCSGSIACALFEPKQQSGRVITLWSGIGGKQLLVTFTLDALQTTETSHSWKTFQGDTLYLQLQTPHLRKAHICRTRKQQWSARHHRHWAPTSLPPSLSCFPGGVIVPTKTTSWFVSARKYCICTEHTHGIQIQQQKDNITQKLLNWTESFLEC